ncbi:MAG: hypothetical protein CM15mP103_01390 [Gammaproteobacteria bacterium]|nr:MAG: hypothetical protein CM15mP103_01390 [Gammaproteobacteria bacterium]
MQGRACCICGESASTMQKLGGNLHIFRGLVAKKCLEYPSDELRALLAGWRCPARSAPSREGCGSGATER